MSLTLTNIDYAGKELAIDIIREAYTSSIFYKNFGARILPSIKGKYYWWDATIDLNVNCTTPGSATYDCPSFDTNFTLNQNFGELCEYHVSGSIRHAALINSAREVNLAGGVLNETTQDDTQVFDALIEMLMNSTVIAQEDNFVNGDATYDCCDGLLAQFEDGTLNRPVPSGQLLTAASITASNVFAELSKVINALPAKYKRQNSLYEKPKFAVAPNIMDAYYEALTYQAPVAAPGGNGVNVNETSTATYRGYELVQVDALADDVMFLTPPNNIGLIWDEDADMNNLVIRNGLEDSTLCKVIKFRMDWRAAIMFGDGDAVVYYR